MHWLKLCPIVDNHSNRDSVKALFAIYCTGFKRKIFHPVLTILRKWKENEEQGDNTSEDLNHKDGKDEITTKKTTQRVISLLKDLLAQKLMDINFEKCTASAMIDTRQESPNNIVFCILSSSTLNNIIYILIILPSEVEEYWMFVRKYKHCNTAEILFNYE